MVTKAAVEGLGATMMDRLIAIDDLESGALVDVFPDSIPVSNGYHFFCDRTRAHEPVIDAFRSWLLTLTE